MPVELAARYLGLNLKNPVVPSSSPLTARMDTLRQLEDAGAAAVVLPSLFEEQIEHEEQEVHNLREYQADSFGEALSFFPEMENYNTGPGEYLELIRTAKEKLAIPVLASLNGASTGGWVHYARLMQEAGADALELNIYFVPTDPRQTSLHVEERYLEIVRAVRSEITIPLAVKVGPFFTAFANMAHRLVEAGADGLVIFNRYLQPDIDLESLAAQPEVVLSRPFELRIRLRWIAILFGELQASLAATTGVHSAQDVLKVLLAGGDVAMTASALLQQGPRHLTKMLGELSAWLEEHEYRSVQEMRGSLSQRNCPFPEAFSRANYMKALTSYSTQFNWV